MTARERDRRPRIDAEELRAFEHQRDITVPDLRLRVTAAETRAASLVAINAEQLQRLVQQDLALAELRRQVNVLTEKETALKEQAAKVSAELDRRQQESASAREPMRSSVDQPLFAKRGG